MPEFWNNRVILTANYVRYRSQVSPTERTPIMLHFQYFLQKLKHNKTSSLILFGACQEKKFLKDNSHASYKDFLFVAVEKERQVFYRVSKYGKSIF